MTKFQIDDQVFILHENRIRYVIINEIRIRRGRGHIENFSVSYILCLEDINDDDRRIIFIEKEESETFETIDELLKFMVMQFKESLDMDDENGEIIHYGD